MTPYYERDGITIYHGDCRDILPTLPPVDLVLTDPPYGVGKADWDALLPLDWLILCRRISPIVAFTPGVTHMYSYPPPDWPLCWARPASVQRNGLGGFNNWEPILVYGKRVVAVDLFLKSHGGDDDNLAAKHDCPKPLSLMRWLTSALSDEGQTILDPFMGSGTTLRAAKDLGRKAIGIEIEERYCEIAVKRLAQEVLAL